MVKSYVGSSWVLQGDPEIRIRGTGTRRAFLPISCYKKMLFEDSDVKISDGSDVSLKIKFNPITSFFSLCSGGKIY